MLNQFRYRGPDSDRGVEYNQDGSIRSTSDEYEDQQRRRTELALKRLECDRRAASYAERSQCYK
jgi:hypothetical protein